MVFITQQTLTEMYVNIINCRDSGLNINQRIKILKAIILLKVMSLAFFTSPQAAKNTRFLIQDRPVRLASSLPGVRLPPSLPSSIHGEKEWSSDTSARREIQQPAWAWCFHLLFLCVWVSHSSSLGSSVFIFMMFPPQEVTMKVLGTMKVKVPNSSGTQKTTNQGGLMITSYYSRVKFVSLKG